MRTPGKDASHCQQKSHLGQPSTPRCQISYMPSLTFSEIIWWHMSDPGLPPLVVAKLPCIQPASSPAGPRAALRPHPTHILSLRHWEVSGHASQSSRYVAAACVAAQLPCWSKVGAAPAPPLHHRQNTYTDVYRGITQRCRCPER